MDNLISAGLVVRRISLSRHQDPLPNITVGHRHGKIFIYLLHLVLEQFNANHQDTSVDVCQQFAYNVATIASFSRFALLDTECYTMKEKVNQNSPLREDLLSKHRLSN